MKLGRNYRLTIENQNGDVVVITDPITIQFTIERSISSSMNTMSALIYNLSRETRDLLFQDFWKTDVTTYRRVIFEAGYDGEYSVVFAGNLKAASSARSGSDIITSIVTFSGGLDTITAQVFETLNKGSTLRDLNKTLISKFTNLQEGALTDTDIEFKRPIALNGNAFYLLKRYNNNKVFIDNEIVHCLADDAYIEGDLPLLNAETGLLETPRREDSYMTISTLFEPRIIIGQAIELQSSVLPLYDGQYKVTGIYHQGTISGSVGGQCVSRFNLLLGDRAFNRLRKAEMAGQ